MMGQRRVMAYCTGWIGTEDLREIPNEALQVRAAMQAAAEATDPEVKGAWLDIARSRGDRLARRQTALNVRR